MIKCKLAEVDGGCSENKGCCCFECAEQENCGSACEKMNLATCDDAVFEGSTELEVFQLKAAAIIKAVADPETAKKALTALK